MHTIQIGETREQGTLRIHRFRPCLKLWDLTNAGKRGKKVRVVYVLASVAMSDVEAELMGRLCKFLDGYTSLERAVSALRDFMVDFPDDITLDEREERGIDVAPAGYQKTEVALDYVRVIVDHASFLVACTVDTSNEPCITQTNVSGAKKFARLWAKCGAAMTRMTLSEFQAALRANGIDYHYWCAVD